MQSKSAYENKSLAITNCGATMTSMKTHEKNSNSMERFTLRLAPEVLEAIDVECAHRIGNVSRNTWITEAVIEKLALLQSSAHPKGVEEING